MGPQELADLTAALANAMSREIGLPVAAGFKRDTQGNLVGVLLVPCDRMNDSAQVHPRMPLEI